MSISHFNRRLTDWYHHHKRSLPWRDTTDPYRIWISEIILQQTRVAQGYDYFLRFVKRFPNVTTLAQASEDEVLKYWQGLGYYTRARNLHAAAKSMNGVFPSDYAGVRALKGVGDYTAAAICSFAYNLPYAVVDGNVYRVLARLFGLADPIDDAAGKKRFAALAQQLLDKQDPATYNQAMMEFGALQCVPSAEPDCARCPFEKECVARREGRIAQLPVKKHKTKTRNRYFHYIYVISGERVWLEKRTGKDIWTGLYQLPLVETSAAVTPQQLVQLPEFAALFAGVPPLPLLTPMGNPVRHVLSHQVLYASFYKVTLPAHTPPPAPFIAASARELEQHAFPRLIHAFLEKQL